MCGRTRGTVPCACAAVGACRSRLVLAALAGLGGGVQVDVAHGRAVHAAEVFEVVVYDGGERGEVRERVQLVSDAAGVGLALPQSADLVAEQRERAA